MAAPSEQGLGDPAVPDLMDCDYVQLAGTVGEKLCVTGFLID